MLPSFPQYTHKSSLVSKRPSHSTACDQDTPWVNPQGNRECCPFPWNVDSNNAKCVDTDGSALLVTKKPNNLTQLIECPPNTNAIDPLNSSSYSNWNKKTVCCSNSGCVPAIQKNC